MTLEEAERAARRVTVVNPGLSRLAIRVARYDEFVGVEITYRPPDRDTGEPTVISMARRWHGFELLHMNEKAILFEVERMVMSAFEHEFKECFHVDGVRLHDPHPIQKATVSVPPTAGSARTIQMSIGFTDPWKP